MSFDVGRLGLQHQPGNVDVSGTLVCAHLAVDAQVSYRPDLIGRHLTRVSAGLKQLAHQVGLGSRRGGLVMRGTEQRTHSTRRRNGATLAAAVTSLALDSWIVV